MVNYPDPFTTSTTFYCDLPRNVESTTIEIFNIKGQLVRTLPAVSNETKWDCLDKSGNMVGSGIYMYRLNINNKNSGKGKMLLIK
jgi:flagellar hook assembly protein FlgD